MGKEAIGRREELMTLFIYTKILLKLSFVCIHSLVNDTKRV